MGIQGIKNTAQDNSQEVFSQLEKNQDIQWYKISLTYLQKWKEIADKIKALRPDKAYAIYTQYTELENKIKESISNQREITQKELKEIKKELQDVKNLEVAFSWKNKPIWKEQQSFLNYKNKLSTDFSKYKPNNNSPWWTVEKSNINTKSAKRFIKAQEKLNGICERSEFTNKQLFREKSNLDSKVKDIHHTYNSEEFDNKLLLLETAIDNFEDSLDLYEKENKKFEKSSKEYKKLNKKIKKLWLKEINFTSIILKLNKNEKSYNELINWDFNKISEKQSILVQDFDNNLSKMKNMVYIYNEYKSFTSINKELFEIFNENKHNFTRKDSDIVADIENKLKEPINIFEHKYKPSLRELSTALLKIKSYSYDFHTMITDRKLEEISWADKRDVKKVLKNTEKTTKQSVDNIADLYLWHIDNFNINNFNYDIKTWYIKLYNGLTWNTLVKAEDFREICKNMTASNLNGLWLINYMLYSTEKAKKENKTFSAIDFIADLKWNSSEVLESSFERILDRINKRIEESNKYNFLSEDQNGPLEDLKQEFSWWKDEIINSFKSTWLSEWKVNLVSKTDEGIGITNSETDKIALKKWYIENKENKNEIKKNTIKSFTDKESSNFILSKEKLSEKVKFKTKDWLEIVKTKQELIEEFVWTQLDLIDSGLYTSKNKSQLLRELKEKLNLSEEEIKAVDKNFTESTESYINNQTEGAKEKIKKIEEVLKNQELTPEERKKYESELEENKKNIENLSDTTNIIEIDNELVERLKAKWYSINDILKYQAWEKSEASEKIEKDLDKILKEDKKFAKKYDKVKKIEEKREKIIEEREKEERKKELETEKNLSNLENKIWKNFITEWEQIIWEKKVFILKENWNFTINYIWENSENKKLVLNENEHKLFAKNDKKWLEKLIDLQMTLEDCGLWNLWNYREQIINSFDDKITQSYQENWFIQNDFIDDFLWQIVSHEAFSKNLENNWEKIQNIVNKWNNPILWIKNYIKEINNYSGLLPQEEVNWRGESNLENIFRKFYLNQWQFKKAEFTKDAA